MIKKSVSLIAFATVLGAFGGAYAAAGDNTIVTSKAYVDNTKQEKITGHAANAADSLLTDSATDGTVQKRAIFNDTAANYDSTTQSTQIPTMGAVMSAISSDSQSPIPAGTNGYLATHSGSEGTFGTPVNPATFQPAITTGMVDFNDGVADLPAITTYDTTGGLVANKIGILDQETIADDESRLDIYSSAGGYGAEMDNYVPTVRAVAEGLQIVKSMNAALPWNTAEQNATGAYNTTFADSGTNVWPTADADKVVKGQAFANAMATKQNKIGVEDDDLIPGQQLVTGMRAVLAPTDTAGIVNQIGLWDADGWDPVSWEDLINDQYGSSTTERQLVHQSIPTVGAVKAGLNSLKDQIDDQIDNLDIPDISNLQTKIAASEWEYGSGNTIPGVVISTDENGVVEQRMILDKTENITDWSIDEMVRYGEAGQGIVTDHNNNSITEDDVNHAVPTTTMTIAIANAATAPLQWATAEQNATGAYSTTFANSGTNWPTTDRYKVVKGETFANAMATKQNKISGHAANAADSLLTDSATDGTVQKRAIYSDTAANYDSTTQSTQIPTMGAVMSAVSAGVSAAAPSGDPNTIANYGANGALGSGIATYSGATQQSPYNAGNDAGKLATAAAVETKQTKKVCYDWPDGVEHTDANCWLWTLPD